MVNNYTLEIDDNEIIDLTVDDDATIELGVSEALANIYYDTDPYTGSYEIDPDFDGITLETENKRMTADLLINPIQVETVINASGGNTVYIGGII